MGGPTDTLARILAENMRQNLGQLIIIESQGAAGGTITGGRVARATPDRYTICIENGNFVLNGAPAVRRTPPASNFRMRPGRGFGSCHIAAPRPL